MADKAVKTTKIILTFSFKRFRKTNNHVNIIITPIKKKVYMCQFESVGTDLKNIPIIIEIQVIMISESKTYISVLYNFENKSDVDIVNLYENNLKNIFTKIKQYINENEKEFNDT